MKKLATILGLLAFALSAHAEGLLYPKSGAKVPVSTIHTILRNRLYTGWFEWNGKLIEGKHPALVSADSSGNPIGADHAAIDLTNAFVTFSSPGSASASGPTQIFLAASFF